MAFKKIDGKLYYIEEKQTICEIITELINDGCDLKTYEKLITIRERAKRMEDRLVKYCNAIEDLGFTRVGRDYESQ